MPTKKKRSRKKPARKSKAMRGIPRSVLQRMLLTSAVSSLVSDIGESIAISVHEPKIDAEFEEPVSVVDVRAALLQAANVLSRNPADTAEAGICILEAVKVLDRLPKYYDDLVRERNDIARVVRIADQPSPGERPLHEVAAMVFDLADERANLKEELGISRRVAQDYCDTIDTFLSATKTSNVRLAIRQIHAWARAARKLAR